MNAEVVRLCRAAREAGGRAMLVGGSVRDRLLGIQSKDFDVEVYGIEPPRLRTLLEQIGHVKSVGEHFSVYKLVFYQRASSTENSEGQGRFEIDVSLPRRESKSGSGHRGFVIEGDPAMTFEEAARRRDFTINAILYDPLTDETIDPYGGTEDLQRRVLRAVAPDTFVEDSLRVLRAAQLAARFEMTIDSNTIELCRSIELSDLPRERIWGEFEKLLTLADRPSIGMDAALELGVFDKLLPEIRALAGAEAKSASREADYFAHTKLSLDEAAQITRDLPKPKRITVMLAVLCHDLPGTPGISAAASVFAPLDRNASEDPTRSVLSKLGVHGISGYDVRSQVLALVRNQQKPAAFYQAAGRISDGDFRRLAQQVDMDLLYRVAKSCALGRASASLSVAEDWFIARARSLGVEHGPPEPLLMGRHLLEAGFEPGEQMGQLLRRVYELQLDGKVTTLEEALAAAREPL